jgi:alpha-beta hydrolase superfamily lysophospholipase
MIHGGGWHSGYFDQLATSLSQDGIFSASYDQIGCGYSEPDPDSPSAGVAHVRVFDWFVEDLCAAIGWMQEEASNTQAPVFLFGESFGALQVSSWQ